MIELPLRAVVHLNRGWEFVRGRVGRRWLAGGGSGGENVDLPHCWNRDDTYQFDCRPFNGAAAYRRRVVIPEAPADGPWRLASDGFYGLGEVWLDGRRVHRFDAQYLGLDVALPVGLPPGEHLLAIRLDNRVHRNVLPATKSPDFLLYGGLTGGLRLEHRPSARIRVGSTALRFARGEDGGENVIVACSAAIPADIESEATVTWTVTTADGRPASDTESTQAVPSNELSLRVDDPRCWSPDQPHLYRAVGRLSVGHDAVDEVRIRFGITRPEFRPEQGFFLDGERIDLRGANRHESIPGLGSALTPELHREDARLLKRLGANLVRLSHYPQSPSFLDACDELGLMVYPEIASWKSVSGRRAWRRAALRQLDALVRRDRHRPSVLLWGMGNESRSRRTFVLLKQLAAELDPDRPVSYAENHLYRARRQKTVGIPQIWSTNYELDVLDHARDASEWRLVILSECGNHPQSIRGDELEELTQVSTIERDWEDMAARQYLIGHAIWSLTDYATEHRGRTRRHSGLLDAWRQPKMAADLFRARYAREPFISLHILQTRRGSPATRFRTEIADPLGGRSSHRLHIFSNCGDLRILQSSQPLASLEATIHTIIPIDPSRGGIEVEGVRDGIAVGARWDPPGEPVAIRVLRADPQRFRGPVIPLDLRIVDSVGRITTSWNGQVRVHTDGGVRALTFTAAGDVLVSRGEGRFYVEIDPANIRPAVAAEAAGLASAELALGASP